MKVMLRGWSKEVCICHDPSQGGMFFTYPHSEPSQRHSEVCDLIVLLKHDERGAVVEIVKNRWGETGEVVVSGRPSEGSESPKLG